MDIQDTDKVEKEIEIEIIEKRGDHSGQQDLGLPLSQKQVENITYSARELKRMENRRRTRKIREEKGAE